MTDMTFITWTAQWDSLATTAAIRLLKLAATIGATFRMWRHNYRSRRDLAMYSRLERADLCCRADVDAEIAKPFWQK